MEQEESELNEIELRNAAGYEKDLAKVKACIEGGVNINCKSGVS